MRWQRPSERARESTFSIRSSARSSDARNRRLSRLHRQRRKAGAERNLPGQERNAQSHLSIHRWRPAMAPLPFPLRCMGNLICMGFDPRISVDLLPGASRRKQGRPKCRRPSVTSASRLPGRLSCRVRPRRWRCARARSSLSISQAGQTCTPGDRGAPPALLNRGRRQAEAGIDKAVVADSCDARNIDSASPIQLDAERRVSQVVDEVRRSAAQATHVNPSSRQTLETLIGDGHLGALVAAGARVHDLYGGVVPHPFVATKAITHPLVGADAVAPAGWSNQFAHLVRNNVAHGFTVFAISDAGACLLEDGPVRIKPVKAKGGRGQIVVHDYSELAAALDAINWTEVSRDGLVLEENRGKHSAHFGSRPRRLRLASTMSRMLIFAMMRPSVA